jgi:hypothetical protein
VERFRTGLCSPEADDIGKPGAGRNACRFDRRELETALNRYRASLVLWPGVWMLVERQPVFTPKPNRLIVSVLVQTWEFDPNNTWLIAVPKPIWLLRTTL